MAMILFNISAAFDTTDHSTLFSCLQTWFGDKGSLLKCFTSYLTECYQPIKMVLLCLIFANIICLTQGSVLGPLLF